MPVFLKTLIKGRQKRSASFAPKPDVVSEVPIKWLVLLTWRCVKWHIHSKHEAPGRGEEVRQESGFPPRLLGVSGRPARRARHSFGRGGSSDGPAGGQHHRGGRGLGAHPACRSRLPHVLLCCRRWVGVSYNQNWLPWLEFLYVSPELKTGVSVGHCDLILKFSLRFLWSHGTGWSLKCRVT